ncbi:FAD-dependent monooxygenase [Nesterenkonia lutea]|uniref:2-polyprenyl-6-methoxyphenol hydroxylase-like FAD-dependent oxidoreductase n=1 Tax=Nesterenkonia lutea TaxID=272919 RepID=A0ABR9JHS2_9MICC|nr:NAD(P)/FAD-dependent oxidoreductase [Nesterenkonia lutea]MBE1525486.1 2-polyprenyl-6-methoxyphenol hydroxylase-like FAD-dependent oxidoreductase [Nesterenkonia lutea]
MSERTENRHAEIAGGGIAGLTAAAMLAKKGWSVRVHERAAAPREIGAGIFIWENAIKSLEEIGAADEISKNWERVDNHQLRDHKGRLLQDNWLHNSRLYTTRRTDLHRALGNAARAAGAEIVTSSPVTMARPEGTLVLHNGEELSADLVIGADGVHSRVRDSLDLAHIKVNMRDGCGRYLVPRKAEDGANITTEAWDGGRRIGIAPVSKEDIYIFLCGPEKDAEARDQKPFNPKPWLESYPQYRDYIERIPRNGSERWAPFYEVETRSWSSGKVALLGDAAHSMAPNLGQAACVAMTNAIALGFKLEAEPDVATALQQWEAEERWITDNTQRYARLYGTIGTRWPHRLQGMRSILMRTVMRSSRFQNRVNAAALHFPSQAR